ncbi:MAG TPA: hypothetical protein VGK16_11765 [Candidatus Limnocylindrales bacterium]
MIELLLQAERALSMGLVDQAEHLYRQAAEADPRNSIAVVGLARVALERGDDVLAWREAKRALTIDAENAAAERMVERFEEVWRHRGQQIPADEGRAVAAVAAGSPAPALAASPSRVPAPNDGAGATPALVPVEASQAWARITGEASAATPAEPAAYPQADSGSTPEPDLRPDTETEPEDTAGRAADDGFAADRDEAYDAAAGQGGDAHDPGATARPGGGIEPGAWPPPEHDPPTLSPLTGLDRVRQLFSRKRE